jgi:hypothetical protein
LEWRKRSYPYLRGSRSVASVVQVESDHIKARVLADDDIVALATWLVVI